MNGMESVRRVARAAKRVLKPGLAVSVAASSFIWIAAGARAETIGGALAKAYVNNPDINQQRAAVRAADEGIPKAFSGFLPTVIADANAGLQQYNLSKAHQADGNFFSEPRGYGLTVTQ